MFESTPSIPASEACGNPGALRSVAWPDLVARLAAQRDLRGVLLSREDNAGASFNASAAALLVQHEYSKREINRDALSDGKYPRANTAEAAGGAEQGDRETL